MWQEALQLSSSGSGTPKQWHQTINAPYGNKDTVDVGFKPMALYASHSENGFNDVPSAANRITYINVDGTEYKFAQQGNINMASYYVIKFTDTGFEFTNNAGNYSWGAEIVVVGV